ncbi:MULTISPECIES: hypothetical protein [Pseudomonas]|uniref:VOC domain-containing protein n=1 Tax=Pseudomonas donghuensis TaxID=1163398 RepID=A0AAP0S9M2_9PSED|nr:MULTISPECIES: hypothetical protein [Pseudomonas]MDF9893688.1 hypothetical protein [Pseudomonas vranovensis]KDN96964.1 hypothetical protein BV82_5173 [Pseudomonas donghuensis]MBS7601253.1 hypothetical protein [Pseudomonas sp. RC2C2]MCP6692440.1 hypothetical protein [Pseudomonas donghuensis]MCP6697890.1 hypothetical protein [Pseudomonas donghuensis]
MSLDFQFDHLAFNTSADGDLQAALQTLLGVEPGPRPAFPFPGHWLYQGGQALVHLIEGEHTRFNHLALRTAHPASAVLERVRASGLPYQVAVLPQERVCQVFVSLPGGLVLELDCPLDRDDIGISHHYQHSTYAPV